MTRVFGILLALAALTSTRVAAAQEFSIRGNDSVGGPFRGTLTIEELPGGDVVVRQKIRFSSGAREELAGRCSRRDYVGRLLFSGELRPLAGLVDVLAGDDRRGALPVSGEVFPDGRIEFIGRSEMEGRNLEARGRVRVTAPGQAPQITSIEPASVRAGGLLIVRWRLQEGASAPTAAPQVRVAGRLATVVHIGHAGLVIRLSPDLAAGPQPVSVDGAKHTAGTSQVSVVAYTFQERVGEPILRRAAVVDDVVVLHGSQLALDPSEERTLVARLAPSQVELTLLAATQMAAAFRLPAGYAPGSRVRLVSPTFGQSNEVGLDPAPTE